MSRPQREIADSARRLINHFKDIPEKDWVAGRQVSSDRTRCCARGHINYFKDGKYYEERSYKDPLLVKLIRDRQIVEESSSEFRDKLTWVNDGQHPHYAQSTPKARVLVWLHDILERNGG